MEGGIDMTDAKITPSKKTFRRGSVDGMSDRIEYSPRVVMQSVNVKVEGKRALEQRTRKTSIM